MTAATPMFVFWWINVFRGALNQTNKNLICSCANVATALRNAVDTNEQNWSWLKSCVFSKAYRTSAYYCFAWSWLQWQKSQELRLTRWHRWPDFWLIWSIVWEMNKDENYHSVMLKMPSFVLCILCYEWIGESRNRNKNNKSGIKRALVLRLPWLHGWRNNRPGVWIAQHTHHSIRLSHLPTYECRLPSHRLGRQRQPTQSRLSQRGSMRMSKEKKKARPTLQNGKIWVRVCQK